MPAFYEFFAGGGMARAGLGEDWKCLFANDIDEKKGASYASNWGEKELLIRDVGKVEPSDVPEGAHLAWASFPCQDLSLAGAGAGLKGERSGTFWPFWNLIKKLNDEERGPEVVVLENVCGALTSHGGKDFAAIGAALAGADYRFGALVIDAIHFVPQSRPRLFIVAVRNGVKIPEGVTTDTPDGCWRSAQLMAAHQKLSRRSKAAWVWWKLPSPPKRNTILSDLIEDAPEGVKWNTAAETRRLLSLMSPLHREKVAQARQLGRRIVGGIYKRMREDENGVRVQRAEVRFDDVAGCLRTPTGGSSRQTILLVEGNRVRSRLLSPRETARLMGLPDTYILPKKYNDAYHLTGDGVVVPAVRFLAEHIFEPIIAAHQERERQAA
jgi:DNA (cytosine-5)-methyltransferase 1